MPNPWRSSYNAFTKSTRDFILSRAHWRCQIRGVHCLGRATVADHIVPDFEGGSNDPDNGQAACDPCHDAKTKNERARARKLRSRYRDPQVHPGLIQ